MAVQAQHPSNVLLLNNRGEQELKDMDYPQAPPGFIDQSSGGGGGGAVFFAPNGAANGNGRKRMREAAAGAPPQLFSLQPAALPSPTFISLAQLHNQAPPPALVSTGLRLALEEQNQSKHNNNNNPMLSSSSSSASTSLLSNVLTDDLAAQLAQQKDEMDQFLLAQGEQLRRAVAERRQRHYRALLDAAEGAAGRRLREKEAEVERAARRGAELEDRIARLRAESMAWQAKAMAEQATAAALHAQLQQAAAAAASASAAKGGDECGESPAADDEGSAYVDPRRAERERACRACRTRPASVVLLPCRHLCLCSVCDSAASGGGVAQTCPVCNCLRTGGVQVFLS